MNRSSITTIAYILSLAVVMSAQTGSTYRIESSTIATGGGSGMGGNFTLDGTAGQRVAGGTAEPSYSVYSGFWTPSLTPTAASVPIGGRIITAAGTGIRNVRLTLTNSRGEIRSALTGPFGYYRFDDVPVGEVYVLTISSKRYVFPGSPAIVNVSDELFDLDFIAAG